MFIQVITFKKFQSFYHNLFKNSKCIISTENIKIIFIMERKINNNKMWTEEYGTGIKQH